MGLRRTNRKRKCIVEIGACDSTSSDLLKGQVNQSPGAVEKLFILHFLINFGVSAIPKLEESSDTGPNLPV
jgi:hypothetical protein